MVLTPARASWAVIVAATLFAVFGAQPWAGGWNDGSRLATVESLVRRGTLAIDDSPYCRPGDLAIPAYDPASGLNAEGTKDKLYIRGRFYSDKPAVVSLLMAGLYRAGMAVGLPDPGDRADVFCLVLTVATAGGAYLISLLCLFRLGRLVGLEGWTLPAWLASFAVATFALTYTRHVNNHVMHLAILSGVCLLAVRVARDGATTGRMVGLGTLAGLGFNLDLGSGPLLVLAVAALVAWRVRRFGAFAVCALAALPWAVAGLGINYAIGGVLIPINMVAEYSAWPGGPFDASNLTGFSRHSPGGLLVYAAALLAGKRGLLTHNLPLLLAVPGLVVLRRARSLRPELVVLVAWCAASWAMYAVLSNNSSGACCSIRWFVPFLAPLYLVVAVYLKDSPRRLADFLVLSAWGAVLGLIMWTRGPWTLRLIPLLWPIVGAALLSLLALSWTRRRAGVPVGAELLRRAA